MKAFKKRVKSQQQVSHAEPVHHTSDRCDDDDNWPHRQGALQPIECDKYPREIHTKEFSYYRFYVRPRAICYDVHVKKDNDRIGILIVWDEGSSELYPRPYLSAYRDMEIIMDNFEKNKTFKVIAR